MLHTATNKRRIVAVYTYRVSTRRRISRGRDVQLTPETSERLTAGVARLVRTVKHLGPRAAADLYGDLPSFGWALLVPLEQDGAQRCSALAERAGVDVSVASRQVAVLERSGLVERRPDPLDGRASLIDLSTAGVAALAHTRRLRGRWAVEALADWTEGEAREFSGLLEKLADGLDRAGGRPARAGVLAAPARAPAAPAPETPASAPPAPAPPVSATPGENRR
ncbi:MULTISPECIES: MarR family winged helix-turn-helix transcriptional regulator [unclassified Modestobacter]|uniref:MarR family winged helix-turn-helix transcriptional regulator n=1 Tax=unclassified Modestobacter TaxID=2643866 RepID=UPI0022AB16CD|nr:MULTISPECIES: MarR family transcriptional regulator [unclassified Modestobacter]MCZ2823393.1 MarR family transcriptional regulator [Modestobacter sp. VKM Ac-2981]MCZ2851638.1 MarR family transcriptional regulator [Modestobacter sp. VKM Ac-2982]